MLPSHLSTTPSTRLASQQRTSQLLSELEGRERSAIEAVEAEHRRTARLRIKKRWQVKRRSHSSPQRRLRHRDNDDASLLVEEVVLCHSPPPVGDITFLDPVTSPAASSPTHVPSTFTVEVPPPPKKTLKRRPSASSSLFK